MRASAEAICLALAHSLWLTSAAAIVYVLARSSLRAAGRHRLGMILLAVSACVPLGTLLLRGLAPAPAATEIVGNATIASPVADTSTEALATSASWRQALHHAPVAITVLWLLGMLVLLARPLVGWWRLRHLASTRWAKVSRAWEHRIQRLGARLDVGRVQLMASPDHEVPFTYGWWRPVVVVPVAMLTDLPLELASLVVEHELTHIARRDYLAQWIQRIAEAVLFFHPLAWWLSRQVSIERELACDANLVDSGRDPLRYARALTELETLRPRLAGAGTSPLALAATGASHDPQPESLMHRIQALFTPPSRRPLRGAAAAALFALGVIGATSAVACSVDAVGVAPTDAAVASAATEGAPDALRISWLPENVTRHAALLTEVGEELGVDADVLALMVLVESFGDPNAISPYGARGLMQLMPATARVVAERHGIELPPTEEGLFEALRDPRTNLSLGGHLVADLRREHDDLTRVWASYNAGSGAVRAHLDHGTPLPTETERYVALLTSLLAERDARTSAVYDAWRERAAGLPSHP